MTKVKIGIRGAYGEQNFGDDALMLFLYRWSLQNDLDVKFVGKENDYIDELIPKDKYILKTMFYKNNFETLILGGGTQFFSFENSPQPTNKLDLLFSNPKAFITKFFAFAEKKLFYNKPNYNKLFAVGIGLGPFIEGSNNEILAKHQIAKMQGLYVRDKYSFNFSKPINDNCFLVTDICFLPNVYDLSQYRNTAQKIENIGIIVRDWNYSSVGKLYMKKIIDQAQKINKEGYAVTFIYFKDEPECEALIDNYNYKKLKWDPLRMKLEDFIKSLSDFDLFISARFHGVIFGALLGIPTIAIEVEPKLKVTKELLGNGVEIWEQPFDKDLLDVIKKMNYLQLKESLKKAVKHQNKIAKEMFNKLYADIS